MPQGEKTMPNIKKLAAAMALSTALTGGVVGVGAMTSAAAAGTTVAAGTSTFANGGGALGVGPPPLRAVGAPPEPHQDSDQPPHRAREVPQGERLRQDPPR
ncbi:hypothetical protein GCM10020219_089300 [Nonomuraea dietziae]